MIREHHIRSLGRHGELLGALLLASTSGCGEGSVPSGVAAEGGGGSSAEIVEGVQDAADHPVDAGTTAPDALEASPPLEDLVIHYEEFFKRSNAVNPPPAMPPLLTTDGVHRDRPNVPAERAALVAYLQTL